jgi:hypothetical protein
MRHVDSPCGWQVGRILWVVAPHLKVLMQASKAMLKGAWCRNLGFGYKHTMDMTWT